jgi:hypothetical protein
MMPIKTWGVTEGCIFGKRILCSSVPAVEWLTCGLHHGGATTAEDLIPIFGSRLAADAKCVLSLPTLLEAVFFPNNTIKYAF